MRNRYFQKAQELCRLAQLTGDAPMWDMAMGLLRRAHQ